MKSFFESLGLALLSVFAPLKSVLLSVGTLVIADLIVGVMAAKKRGEHITSSGFKRTVGKLLVYEFAIALSYIVHQYLTGDLLPADKILTALIGVTELKSVMENLQEIYGGDVFSVLAKRITAAEQTIEKPTTPPTPPQK